MSYFDLPSGKNILESLVPYVNNDKLEVYKGNEELTYKIKLISGNLDSIYPVDLYDVPFRELITVNKGELYLYLKKARKYNGTKILLRKVRDDWFIKTIFFFEDEEEIVNTLHLQGSILEKLKTWLLELFTKFLERTYSTTIPQEIQRFLAQ